MAKIAQCSYGSRGQSYEKNQKLYAYVVNDNVRTKDVLQVVATSSKGRKFGTTAMARNIFKQDSVKGIEATQKAKQGIEEQQARKGIISSEEPKLTKVETGKELNVSASRRKTITMTGEEKQSAYTQLTRGGNLLAYQKENPNAVFTENAQKDVETFESYSNKFMNKGGN